MIIFPDSKLVYVAEPRTASRSTHAWMEGRFGGYCYRGWSHMGPVELHQRIKRGKEPALEYMVKDWEKYHFFAVTRNPFDIVATYFIDNRFNPKCKAGVPSVIAAREAKDLTDYLRRIIAIEKRHISEDEHMQRLRDVQHTEKYEDGVPGVLVKVMREHGIEVTDEHIRRFPREGVTANKKHWRTYYDDESRELVEGLYPNYMQKYGYTFGDPA